MPQWRAAFKCQLDPTLVYLTTAEREGKVDVRMRYLENALILSPNIEATLTCILSLTSLDLPLTGYLTYNAEK